MSPVGISDYNINYKSKWNFKDEPRPPSENKGDLKRGRNEGSSGRSSTLNMSSSTGSTSRRTTTNTPNTASKDSGTMDQ